MSSKEKEEICKKFGINSLTSFQKKVIYELNHGHDIIGLTRTGEGKSICYPSQVQQGKLQVLFVSPERLTTHKLWELLQDITIHTIAIDEVHCLIEWGNEFRPMYQKIGRFIHKLHHRPVIAAFSVTVPRDDIPFISDSLDIDDYRVHIRKLKQTNLII